LLDDREYHVYYSSKFKVQSSSFSLSCLKQQPKG
jgi:hypothetical protein